MMQTMQFKRRQLGFQKTDAISSLCDQSSQTLVELSRLRFGTHLWLMTPENAQYRTQDGVRCSCISRTRRHHFLANWPIFRSSPTWWEWKDLAMGQLWMTGKHILIKFKMAAAGNTTIRPIGVGRCRITVSKWSMNHNNLSMSYNKFNNNDNYIINGNNNILGLRLLMKTMISPEPLAASNNLFNITWYPFI